MNNTYFKDNFQYIAKGYRPLCNSDKGLLTYHKNSVFLYDSSKNTFEKLLKLDGGIKARFKESTRALSRLFRSEPYSCIVFNGILFVAQRNKIIQISLCDNRIVNESSFRRSDIHMRKFVPIVGVSGFDDCIAFGEYLSNAKHESVRVYCSIRDGDHYNWECRYVFPENTVRHIHSLLPDPQNKCVYIFTGDNDSESGIWRAVNGFSEVSPLLTGDQKYRAGTGFIRNNCLYYATDSPCRDNMIVKIDLQNGKYQKLCDFPGSCTSSCMAGEKLVFCSTIEPEEPKDHGKKEMLRYYFSKKLASGMTDGLAHIFIENEFDKFDDTVKFQKDFLPGPLFQFGRAVPHYDAKEKALYFYFIGLKKIDGKMYRMRFE